jgi:hypothetical protein
LTPPTKTKKALISQRFLYPKPSKPKKFDSAYENEKTPDFSEVFVPEAEQTKKV